mmetsp:Transcript_36500/g.90538  ORF Transcript_36500/g.90538 Transcript_36500/m.90538 type:complete len:92 (+) Transcript_36500:208-483(+)
MGWRGLQCCERHAQVGREHAARRALKRARPLCLEDRLNSASFTSGHTADQAFDCASAKSPMNQLGFHSAHLSPGVGGSSRLDCCRGAEVDA